MKEYRKISYPEGLEQICDSVRDLVLSGDYKSSISLISNAMEQYPHAPHPHNLMGIVLEKMGDHLNAMKHFRASHALDPAYTPTTYNLNVYGTFFSGGSCAFDEEDVLTGTGRNIKQAHRGLKISRLRGDRI